LRTPLNAIVGFGDMLHQEILGPLGVARYREYAADICASGQRLLSLVSRMLDLAEVEAGTLTLDRGSMSPAGALLQAVAAVRPIAEKEHITFQTAIDPANIPAISGDADKLRQAFTSVLHNAVKFTPSGGRVAASMMFDGRDITVRIEDCGAGMSAADIEIVTRPFHRLRSALDGQHQGAGLGLPFAKAIVDLHDGSLIINSAEGAGTTIEIRLPSERAALSNAA
jgi:two-component system cell cycle sensor histidine kinase PleC